MPITCNQSGYIGNITYSGNEVKLTGKPFSDVVSENDVKYDERTKFADALTSVEWKKYNNAMATKLDAGLRINDHAMLVECEDGDYSYKLVVYDNTFDNNPIVAVYGINRGQEDISPDNFYENKV